MATKSDTFERKEKKYLITAEQCQAIKAGLAAHMRLDDYGATRIDSLYLDTPDRSLICRSLEKPLYKEKMRIRSYGPFSEAQAVFVELKKKFDGIVYKRRVKMSRRAASAFCTGGIGFEQACALYPLMEGAGAGGDAAANAGAGANKLAAGGAASGNGSAQCGAQASGTASAAERRIQRVPSRGEVQIGHEIEAFLKRYDDLAPSMLISCLREAWCPIDPADEDCVDRVTFDEDISYVDLMQPSSVQRCHVTAPDQVVMEIKCAGGYPTWLCALLSDAGAMPRSFSKYGNAYKRVLADQGTISVNEVRAGKVSVHRIPSARERAGARAGDQLLGPSAGYELPRVS